MEAALLLLIVTFVNLALSVWLVARHREYLRRITRIEAIMDNAEKGNENKSEYELVPVDGATKQDMEQAAAILDALMKANGNGK